jgi:thioredoxin reductase/polyferredoxin
MTSVDTKLKITVLGPIKALLDSPNMPTPRPVLSDDFESNVRGLFIVGDLAGAPVVKLAMEQGDTVARTIAARKLQNEPKPARPTPAVSASQNEPKPGVPAPAVPTPAASASQNEPKPASSFNDLRNKPSSAATPAADLQNEPNSWDLIVIGAGASGLNAALTAQELGLRVLVLEKSKLIATFEDFPEGKWIYAEPEDRPARGRLWLEGAPKEDLIQRWTSTVNSTKLDIRIGHGVDSIRKRGGGFHVTAGPAVYRASFVILATGQRGNPRKLGVPGEDRSNVFHRLYSPKHYTGEDILVVGGGNSAVEAALALAEQNRVVISYRGSAFTRIFKDNRRRLDDAVARGRIRVIFNSTVKRFDAGTCLLSTGPVPCQHAFVLIGAEAPTAFLKSLGIRLENQWTPKRFALLAATFVLAYTIYGVKQGSGAEFWPFRGWGAQFFTFFDRPWSFWYTVLYTAVMTIFGIQAMKRWGIDRKDRFQIWRYVSLIGFQWVFFFLIPEFLFRWAVQGQWVGAQLASDPNFANNAWRSYGLVYAWPLFFYTFFGSPNQVWIVWGAILSFVIIPVLVLFHGKRYCSWICGCGGLAETLGDRWRHLAPKGPRSIAWERMNGWVLIAAVVITIMMVARDAVTAFRSPADSSIVWYRLIVDTWLVGIVPVALYPFFGGKVWCRYWCPLAKMMQIFSAVFTRFRASRFAIHSNDKCIACGECSRNCQVGIDVMQFAMKQEELNNFNTSCIGCGICVTVCPMSVLSFQPFAAKPATPLVQIASPAVNG